MVGADVTADASIAHGQPGRDQHMVDGDPEGWWADGCPGGLDPKTSSGIGKRPTAAEPGEQGAPGGGIEIAGDDQGAVCLADPLRQGEKLLLTQAGEGGIDGGDGMNGQQRSFAARGALDRDGQDRDPSGQLEDPGPRDGKLAPEADSKVVVAGDDNPLGIVFELSGPRGGDFQRNHDRWLGFIQPGTDCFVILVLAEEIEGGQSPRAPVGRGRPGDVEGGEGDCKGQADDDAAKGTAGRAQRGQQHGAQGEYDEPMDPPVTAEFETPVQGGREPADETPHDHNSEQRESVAEGRGGSAARVWVR